MQIPEEHCITGAFTMKTQKPYSSGQWFTIELPKNLENLKKKRIGQRTKISINPSISKKSKGLLWDHHIYSMMTLTY